MPLSTVAETGWEKEKGSKVTGKKEKVGKLGLHEDGLVWVETGFNVAWLLNGLICLISMGMDWAIKYRTGLNRAELDLKRKKSILQPPTIAPVRFSTSMYKTRNLATSNYQNRLYFNLITVLGGFPFFLSLQL